MTSKAHQYTIRNVPSRVDRALRTKAARKGMSLNALVLAALEAEAGVATPPRLHHDLDDLFGSWVPDRAVDRALEEQRRVEPGDWR